MNSPLITMSAITGKPNETEIFEYLKMLKDNGIDQAMIYPRSGCELEYLSDEWFNTVKLYLNSAKILEMSIWIYDDFNWPSGDACGRVTKFEEFRLKSMKTSGENIGTISYHSTHNASLFGEKYFPDLLNERAVDYFIECTHEKYFEKFGKYFGTVIKGFFTDEPAIGYCCTNDSIPYYKGIEDDYFELFGNDFKNDLTNKVDCFVKNCMFLISERFRKCFIAKISDWCECHRVYSTGHLLCDTEPRNATIQSGDFLKNLSTFMIPGIDEFETNFESNLLFSLLGGIEYSNSEFGAMAELFALGPCDMTYAKKKCMIYLCASFKVNHYFLAISHLDLRGNSKITDYFNDFTSDQPDFKGTKLLAKEAEIAAQYAKKDYIPDVYIRYPTDICLAGVTKPIDTGKYLTLINALTYNQIQWKFLNTNDEACDAPIVEFNEDFDYLIEDIIVESVEEIINLLNIKPKITTKDGKTPKGVFARFFNDDTFIVINLLGYDGEYLINGKNITLGEHQVYISDKFEEETGEKTFINDLEFNVNYCNNNIIRTMYLNSNTNAVIKSDNDKIIFFAVRNDTDAYINGEKINCSNKNNFLLSTGFKKIYSTSNSTLFKRGESVISSTADYKYLPSVLIIGDFEAEIISKENLVRLRDRKKVIKCGEYVSDFGKIEIITSITIPKNVTAIELVGTKLYTTVYFDDILLGEKICSPYIYKVGKEFWNKSVTLKIVEHSSIAPIFGDVSFFDENSATVQWRGTPNTENTLFGIKHINLIFGDIK